MAETIRLYDLRRSPNNVKVRVALRYKGLKFESIPVPVNEYPPSAKDREEVVRVSGQPLAPVLVHGETVLFDSAAILRYLEANFRKSPPLFSADYEEMKQIEEWERWGRTDLPGPISICFRMSRAKEKDHFELQRANQQLHELTGRIEKRLEAGPWLVGSRMTAADVTAAPAVYLGMLPEEAAAESPMAAFFVQNLSVGDGRDRTRDWARRVMAYDR